MVAVNNVWIALCVLNGVSLLLMFIDKAKAVFKVYRIPEKTFVVLGLLGGGIGIVLGMLLFRHKIRKPLFTIGIPLISVVSYSAWWLLLRQM